MRKFNRHSFIIMSIFCLCLLLQGQRAAAQVASGSRAPKPEELLDRMRQALDALGAAEFTFEFRAENGAGDLLGEESGRFIAQGECFRLEGSVLTVYCDGVSKWIYDEGLRRLRYFRMIRLLRTRQRILSLSCARRVPGTTLSADRCAEQQRLWTGRTHGSCPWPPRTAMRPIS